MFVSIRGIEEERHQDDIENSVATLNPNPSQHDEVEQLKALVQRLTTEIKQLQHASFQHHQRNRNRQFISDETIIHRPTIRQRRKDK